MFIGFGSLCGPAHPAGQDGDRSPFQLVSIDKLSYRPHHGRAAFEVVARKQSDQKLVNRRQTAKQK
jgi:hypothetical protein